MDEPAGPGWVGLVSNALRAIQWAGRAEEKGFSATDGVTPGGG